MNYSFLSRTRILSFCILVFSAILIGKLFFIQVIHSVSYKERASHQYATPSSDIFERGTIYFNTKDNQLVSAAIQTTGFKLAINPTEITDIDSAYQSLTTIIPIDHDQFFSKALKKGDPYEEVANRLSKEQADVISLLKITGVYIYKEKWRFYPGDNLASQALGFVGYKGNDLGGRYGLEREYNNTLTKTGDDPYVNFFAEVFSNIKKNISANEPKSGELVTTIEPTVEGFLEKKLEEVKDKYQADAIGGIILNPKDGSIYAMSTKPDFDLNNFSKVTNATTFSNPLIENVYEFGSVVKPLVMAAGLDTGVLTANTTYDDKGFVIVDKKRINNFDNKGRGPGTTMQGVLNESLNTGMVFVAQKLGHDNIRNYLLSYGISQKTGIDLPNETSGLVSNILKSPRDLEYANAAFGQGIAMTPMEVIRALASLSNGGNLVTPHLVSAIKYDDGTVKEMTYPTTRTKISEQTAEEITRMLVTIMDTALGGGVNKFEHYSVAVKTGTAQVANHETGGYYADRHTHSFFGYFPAYDPKFIIFLYAINPKGVQYSSETWTNPFLDLTKFLLNYYEVPPNR